MAYLHLGGEVAILDREVIAILDLKSQATSEASLEFLQIVREEGFVKGLGGR